MYDDSASGMAYNRFTNLDGIEDRIIRYLLYYDNKEGESPAKREERRLVTQIRRILLYNDVNALKNEDEGGYPDPDNKGKAYVSVGSGLMRYTNGAFKTGDRCLVHPQSMDLPQELKERFEEVFFINQISEEDHNIVSIRSFDEEIFESINVKDLYHADLFINEQKYKLNYDYIIESLKVESPSLELEEYKEWLKNNKNTWFEVAEKSYNRYLVTLSKEGEVEFDRWYPEEALIPESYMWVDADAAIDILIFNDCDYDNQSDKRIFRSPRLDDVFNAQCSMLKIYIDTLIPTNHCLAIANVGIDIVVNTKIINVQTSEQTPNGYIYVVDKGTENEHIVKVHTKSRVTVLLQSVLAILNGAEVQGVGKLVFSRQQSIYNKAQYGLWNHRDFEGIKIVMGVSMSGVN